MTKAKRPQDWSAEARLDMVISCASLDKEQISELCRTQEAFPSSHKAMETRFYRRVDGHYNS